MNYLLYNWLEILALFWQHIWLTGVALLVSIAIAMPVGWLLYLKRRLVTPVLGVLGIIYTIPSIALLILLLPFFGLNARSVIVALILYNQVILVRNVLAGLDGISPAIIEAAHGMGMSRWQVAYKVQLPLALPVILTGVRVAAVVSIAIATIGARFGAGGLGVLLFDGIAEAGRIDKIWIGAMGVAILALAINRGVGILERHYFSY